MSYMLRQLHTNNLRRSTAIISRHGPVLIHGLDVTAYTKKKSSGFSMETSTPTRINVRYFSDGKTESSFTLNPMTWWRNSQERDEEKKFKERMEKMANTDTWTLHDVVDELKTSLNTWKAKIPGVGSMPEVKSGKQMLKMAESLVEVVGDKSAQEDVEKLKKIDKLKAANIAEVSMEDLSMFLHQFQNLCTLQRVVRQRKLQGKSLPSSMDNAQAIVQKEGIAMFSRKQKQNMRKLSMKEMNKFSRN